MARLGKLAKTPFARFTPKAIIRYLIYLPLNFIPVVGTLIFIILQGRKFGPQAHARYFQLKKMNNHRQEEFVEQRRGAYTRYAFFHKVMYTANEGDLASVSQQLFSNWFLS
jgi:hypothetical protein